MWRTKKAKFEGWQRFEFQAKNLGEHNERLFCVTEENERHSLHELEADAEVVTEVEVLQHVYHIVTAVCVLLPQVVQDPHFYQRLVVKSLLIPVKQNILMTNDFHCYQIPPETLSNTKQDNLETSL